MKELINLTLGKANRNRPLYKQSALAVRDHLVNPLLTHLGWDTADADFVIPSHVAKDAPAVRYALVKEGKSVSYVETCNLATQPLAHIEEVAAYCQRAAVAFGILTNGLKWLLINTTAPHTRPEDRIIWQIDLEADLPMNITRRFKSIEYGSVERIENLIAKERILTEVWDDYLRNPEPLNDEIAELFRNHIALHYPDIAFDGEATKIFFKKKLEEWTLANPRLA